MEKYSRKEEKKKITDFPEKGKDQEISISNSNYPQADFEYTEMLRKEYPELWKKGGNIYGNTAYKKWTAYRKHSGKKELPVHIQKWIKKREGWFARHFDYGKSVASIISWLKWGGYGHLGESGVKKVLAEEMKKIDEKRKKKKEVTSTSFRG